MKVSLRAWLATAVLSLGAATVSRGEEITLAPKFDPFAAPVVEKLVDGTPITLVNHAGCTDEQMGACQSCPSSRHVGRDFFVCRDRCCGLVGGFEFLLLRPYATSGLLTTAPGGAQMNFNPSWRSWVGYQNADGLGGRFRYWEFDHGATGVGSGFGLEFRTMDLELTQAVDFRRWNFLFAGGLRYAETNFDFTGTVGGMTFPAAAGFDGCGLTVAAQATRDLFRSSSLRMTMGARWSALYGNSKESAPPGAPTAFNRDDLVEVLELNIGPQYRRLLGNGAYLTIGGGLEAQYWANAIDTPLMIAYDVGFVGFGSSIALTR